MEPSVWLGTLYRLINHGSDYSESHCRLAKRVTIWRMNVYVDVACIVS